MIFRMQSDDAFIATTNSWNDFTKKSRFRLKIDCIYVWITSRKYNLIESFSIVAAMHKINRWLTCWMIDNWMKIWFFFESLYVWITKRDFSYIFFVFSFLISFTKRALNMRVLDDTSISSTKLKFFFSVNRWFFFALMRWTEMNFRSKNNLNCPLIESTVC